VRALRVAATLAGVLALSAGAQVTVSRWGSYKQLPHARVDRKTLNLHLAFPLFDRPTGNRAQANLVLNYDAQTLNLGTALRPGGRRRERRPRRSLMGTPPRLRAAPARW
jgi:hypothetical protein